MKKILVLGVLFILPIVAYLFFASGVHSFAKLPIITEKVSEPAETAHTLESKITILGFMGDTLQNEGSALFNLNQKIYKYFYEFNDFQFLYLIPHGFPEADLQKIKKELSGISNLERWHFVYTDKETIRKTFKSLRTPYRWDPERGSPYVFIIDKDLNLRGRDEDEHIGTLYGYNSEDIAMISNKMVDDVKIVLAEYRLALKKNNADRKK